MPIRPKRDITCSKRFRGFEFPLSASSHVAPRPCEVIYPLTRRYLLGSGGTLLFDLTIMIQSVLYGSAKPVSALATKRLRLSSGRKKWKHTEDGMVSSRTMNGSIERLGASERSPLLNGTRGGHDAQHGHHGPSVHHAQPAKPPHVRGRSTSPDAGFKYAPADGR